MLLSCRSLCRYNSIGFFHRLIIINSNRYLHGVHFRQPHTPEKVIFSGIQPTGVPHIGNYLGAMQQWVRLQDSIAPEAKLLFSIVDLHAITVPQDSNQLKQWKRKTLAILLAIGLDPERSTIFYQSSVPAHTELMWILSCTASMGYLSRMTQWKSKLQSDPDKTTLHGKLGLFSYPVLQAADILVHRATHVPVGEDQCQHLEFARECAANFNHIYGGHLKSPETITTTAKRVMSLQEPHLKMSKSHKDSRSRILLTDSPAEITQKIMSALTDSVNSVSYDPVSRPGVSNLLLLLSYFSLNSKSPQELGEIYSGQGLKEFKALVSHTIADSLDGIRARYTQLMGEDGGRYLDYVEANGAEKARANAEATMAIVRDAVGV